MWYDDLLEEVSDPETKRLRSLAVRAINQGMYDDGANLAVRARNAAMAGRTRAERADLHLDLIAYGPARHLVSAAVRHLLANQYEECLHAIQLAGALYEYSNASDYDLKEYWEIVGLAYRGLGDEREMDNAFILARLSDSSLQRPRPVSRPVMGQVLRRGGRASPDLPGRRPGRGRLDRACWRRRRPAGSVPGTMPPPAEQPGRQSPTTEPHRSGVKRPGGERSRGPSSRHRFGRTPR